jgi:glycosyltransferase involved in cell wall biosynthesis
MLSMQLSLVLPCFNEAANIERTALEVLAWLQTSGTEGDVIIVDDGSSDDSPRILRDLSQKDKRIRIVTHATNKGYGEAVKSGCDAARKEWIAFMDSDGQFQIKDLALLLAQSDRYAFVTGRRRKRADPFFRVIFGKLLGLLIFINFGLWLRDVNCGMKLFRKDIWLQIRPTAGREKFFNAEMFLRLKRQSIPWLQVDVPHYPRLRGTPTGGTFAIIVRMMQELRDVRRMWHAK